MVKLIYNQYKIKSCLILSILFLLYGLFTPSEAIAGVFDPPVTDKSVEYLGIVFGNNIGGLHLGTSTNTSAFLGNLFEKLNGIVVAIATVVLLYTSILSTVNTAQDGEIMGKKWSSVWIPLRSSMGLLLLAPIPGSGYSLIQVAVMWIVLNGIGAADTIWNLVADSIATGINVVQNQKNSDQLSNLEVRSLINNATMISPNIFRSLVCLELLNKYTPPEDLTLLEGNPGPYFTDPIENSSGELTANLKFGVQTASGQFSVMKDICGNTTITVAPLIQSEMQRITALPLTNEQIRSIKLAAFEIKKTALRTLMSSMNDLANTIAKFDPENLNQAIPLLSEGALS
ncbi:MAG: DotA/TraY family protein, partial [Gammaproteobacteria bacterium]